MLSSSITPRTWSLQVTGMNLHTQTHSHCAVWRLTPPNYLSANNSADKRVCEGASSHIRTDSVTMWWRHHHYVSQENKLIEKKAKQPPSDSTVTHATRLRGRSNIYLHSTTATVIIKVLVYWLNFFDVKYFQGWNPIYGIKCKKSHKGSSI